MEMMNMVLMSMGAFFAVLDSLTMLVDMAKNVKGLKQFMRGTITNARKKLERKAERKVFNGVVYMLLITQVVLLINMIATANSCGMVAITHVLSVTLVLFVYTSIRNMVLVKDTVSQKVIDFAMKFIMLDTSVILFVNIGQLLCVGTFIYCLVTNIQINMIAV